MVDAMGYSDIGCYGGEVKTPKTWHITSDMQRNFIHYNNLDEVAEQKYKEIGQIRFDQNPGPERAEGVEGLAAGKGGVFALGTYWDFVEQRRCFPV